MHKVKNLKELESVTGLPLSEYCKGDKYPHEGIALANMSNGLCLEISEGHAQAIKDGCQIIALDPHLPFGKLIKSNIARALKKSSDSIPPECQAIIIDKTTILLSLSYCPRETEDYCKLVRKLGTKAINSVVSQAVPRDSKSKALVLRLSEVT